MPDVRYFGVIWVVMVLGFLIFYAGLTGRTAIFIGALVTPNDMVITG